jgi:hypothetical protein
MESSSSSQELEKEVGILTPATTNVVSSSPSSSSSVVLSSSCAAKWHNKQQLPKKRGRKIFSSAFSTNTMTLMMDKTPIFSSCITHKTPQEESAGGGEAEEV